MNRNSTCVVDGVEERPDILVEALLDPPLAHSIRGRIQRIVLSMLVPDLTVAQNDNPTSNADSMSGMADKS
jgi:hypothetical protein